MTVTPDQLRVRWFSMRATSEKRFPGQARMINELFQRIDAGQAQPTDLGTLIALLDVQEKMLARETAAAAADPASSGLRLPAGRLAQLRQGWTELRALARREQPDLGRDLDQALLRLERGKGKPADLALVELGLDWARHLGARPDRWEQPDLA